jgi:phospholipase/carboxylesterase
MSGDDAESDGGEGLASAIEALVPPLLDALDALRFAARHLHPLHLASVAAAVARTDAPVRDALAGLHAPRWPARLHWLRTGLERAAGATVRGLEGLRVAGETGDTGSAWRSLRYYAEACDALWPLVRVSPVVSRFFLDDAGRGDEALLDRIDGAEATGGGAEVLHVDNVRGTRGGYSLFLPAVADGAAPAPLVVALHGGRGHGSVFLWNWLPAARAAGCILVAPTATGATRGPPRGDRRAPRPFDGRRVLLTGMSDGGTFCWVTGLQGGTPFTHLAPFSASFHPLLVEFADAQRLRGLPVHIVHGAQDWMFPPEVAHGAAEALRRAGADVVHREIADLPHCFATDQTGPVLRWFLGGAVSAR